MTGSSNKFINKAFKMKPPPNGNTQTSSHDQSEANEEHQKVLIAHHLHNSITNNNSSTSHNNLSTCGNHMIESGPANQTQSENQNSDDPHLGHHDQFDKCSNYLNGGSTFHSSNGDVETQGSSERKSSELDEDAKNSADAGNVDLKLEDYELLVKLEEANRLIESDSKSLSFSGDVCSKSSSSSCVRRSSSPSGHEKSLSTSSGSSSASCATRHKKSSSVSSVIGNFLSRQNSLSSERSECSHKIGIPCSCSQSQTPDVVEEADKELLCDSWSTWRQIADNWEVYKDKKSFIKEMVRRGIPSHFRGLIWPLLSGASDSVEKSNYKIYLRRSSRFEKFIRRDVSRTYPNHDMFKELDGPGQESLFNVIKAYSIIDPEVGYCQGSAFVAGLLLMQMPEEDAFAVFVRVMQKYGLRELYKPSMARIELCIYQLECMIQDKDPSLYQHFQAHGMFASTFATPWFLSLFATSLPLSLSCRVLDLFLLEGMNSIMSLSYAMMEISSQELKTRDMEDMIKLLGKELPQRLELNPDLLFTTSFKVKFCPKKMKKLEKDYNLIKTKENEENIERKRLRTENKLLRQRIERLEEETSALADRLVQDQMKYANQEEELYSLKRKLSLSLQSDPNVPTSTTTAPDVLATDGVQADAKELQNRIDELVNREVSHLAEMHDLKMTITELEKKDIESHGNDMTDLQQQLVLSKLREAEMNTSSKELEQRVVELDKYWQKHQELMNSGEGKPKVQKAKIQILTEELFSAKLRETNLSKELMELKLKAIDLETKNHVNERLIRKLEEEKETLMELVSEFESNKNTCEDQIRCLRRQLSTTESKQQNDELMAKIKDAETSQTVAELKQKIASLEIQNQELLTAEKLFKGTTQVDNMVDIDAKIEELHQQIVQLKEKKRSIRSGSNRNDESRAEASSSRNYGVESDSDMDDFDTAKYKLKGNSPPFYKFSQDHASDKDVNLDPPKSYRNEITNSADSVTSASSSMSLEGLTLQSSSDSDFFREDVLSGHFDRHDEAVGTSSNPDVILDSVFNDSEPSDPPSEFMPASRSSPANSGTSCSFVKRPEVYELPVQKFSLESDEQINSTLVGPPLEDPDKTPTNEIKNNSTIDRCFAFGRESTGNKKTIRQTVSNSHVLKISSDAFPDILSDSNTLNEIVRNSMSSLIAGLDLPGDKCTISDDRGSRHFDVKVASDKNLSLSLDILSSV